MKILLLNGGGIDTLAVAKMARERYKDDTITSFFVSFGSPNTELAAVAAKKIADKYCDAHVDYRLHGPQPLFRKRNERLYGVPHYALLVCSLGSTYAVTTEQDVILTGLKCDARKGDFFEKLTAVMATSGNTKWFPNIISPLFRHSFDQVVSIIGDDPLLRETWSCNFDVRCGVCDKCINRKAYGID